MASDRTAVLQVRLTPEEKDQVEEAAKYRGLSISAHARERLLDDAETVRIVKVAEERVPAPIEEERGYDPMEGVEAERRAKLRQRKL